EIVLACIAMAILMFGVLRRQDSTLLCTMFALGGLLITALLILTGTTGIGYNGQFVTDSFSAFNQILILAGAALTIIVGLDWNRRSNIARFEFPVLVVLSTVGMLVMTSAANLMTLYLGLELHPSGFTCSPPSPATTSAHRRPGSSI